MVGGAWNINFRRGKGRLHYKKNGKEGKVNPVQENIREIIIYLMGITIMSKGN